MKLLAVLLVLAGAAATADALMPNWLFAAFVPKCPTNLPTPECSCWIKKKENGEVHPRQVQIYCQPSSTATFEKIVEVVHEHGGLVGKLSIQHCATPIGTIKQLSRMKVYDLEIANCGVKDIDQRAFSSMAFWLESLSLLSNQLTSLDFGIHQLYHLRALNLGGNSIHNVPRFTFQHNPELTFLCLCNNNLEHIAGDSFSSTTNKLGHLGLRHNRLRKLPKVLSQLPFLFHLDIGYNNISYLPVPATAADSPFASNRLLIVLQMDGNNISHLPSSKNLFASNDLLVLMNATGNPLEAESQQMVDAMKIAGLRTARRIFSPSGKPVQVTELTAHYVGDDLLQGKRYVSFKTHESDLQRVNIY